MFASNFLDANDENGLREIYKWGMEDAAITHGHENAHNSSGVLAAIVAAVVSGTDLPTACRLAIDKLANKEVAAICNEALRLAADFADVEHLESLGEGWVAEEKFLKPNECSTVTGGHGFGWNIQSSTRFLKCQTTNGFHQNSIALFSRQLLNRIMQSRVDFLFRANLIRRLANTSWTDIPADSSGQLAGVRLGFRFRNVRMTGAGVGGFFGLIGVAG